MGGCHGASEWHDKQERGDGVTEQGNERHSGRGFTTRAVHAGERPPRPTFTPTVTPIYPTVSYLADDPETQDAVFGGEQEGYVYTRHGNPTTRALEVAIATLEGTEDAIAFGSGMAALLAAVMNEVQAGQSIVAACDLYGATQAQLVNVFGTLGVKTTFVDVRDLDQVHETLARVRPRVLLCETISNPLVHVADIPALVAIARQHRVRTIVDNTFATPLLVNPARFGVHTVVHSTTKYLGGHGDATGGVIASTHDRVLEITELAKLTGSGTWSLRGLADAAGREDVVAAHAAAVRQRGHAGSLAQPAPTGGAGLLPRLERAGTIALYLQRRAAGGHRGLRHRRGGTGRGLSSLPGPAHLPPRDDARRRLHDHPLPGHVDAPHVDRGPAGSGRDRQRAGEALGRYRGRRRSHRRPGGRSGSDLAS